MANALDGLTDSQRESGHAGLTDARDAVTHRGSPLLDRSAGPAPARPRSSSARLVWLAEQRPGAARRSS
jgi:hypothetical protein